MTSEPARYELSTLEDVIALYRKLPAERGDLMIKEIGDAIRWRRYTSHTHLNRWYG